MSTVIIKGNIIHTPTKDKFECFKDSYLVAVDNSIVGIFDELPEEFAQCHVDDYGDKLIIPGLCDMHVHAPQFAYRGLGTDMLLLDWLNTYAFPTESKFKDLDFAKVYYEAFADALAKSGTTRAVVFASKHVEATELLMKILEDRKIYSYVGKVNMDTFCPDYICEDSVQSIEDTKRWLDDTMGKYKFAHPVITPRFIPTCSTYVLEETSKLAAKYNLPIQSHCSEDYDEMKVCKNRYPEFESDGAMYDHFGLFTDKTVMAHLILPTQKEMELVQKRGVTIAHCPQSNVNLRGGVAPIRQMMNLGIKVGLGSDVAGGCNVSIFDSMKFAEYLSKIKWMEERKNDGKNDYLKVPEVFYLGTKGGGQFFGKVGSFEKGYELDAVVVDDSNLLCKPDTLSLEERIGRVIHISDDRNIVCRYVCGEKN